MLSEAELTGQVGRWIGQQLLGAEVMEALLDEAPITVRIPVPENLGFLPYRPWEVAAWKGQTLGREQVGIVFDMPDTRRPPRASQHDEDGARPLRVLALYSLPTGATVLGLRRERYALDQLISQLGQGQRPRAVQLRVLQYGVTRDALRAAVEDEDGWDVLHVSGHGGAEVLVLETEDGSPDQLNPAELVELLYPMRRRLRLAVLAACESGAATAAEILRMLKLNQQAKQLEEQAKQEADPNPSYGLPDEAASADGSPSDDGDDSVGWPGLGRALVRRMGCAVLAMRYPVVDDFAISLTGRLYEGLFERGQSLDVALARALPRAASNPPSLGAPAVSLATPTLLGPAIGLKLQPPPGRAALISLTMAGFPPEPSRFVGRTAVLTKARQLLLPRSGHAGVLLHGIAGAGKTSAALELAYQTAATFTAAAYWTAPPADQWHTAVASLALGLETQLNPDLNPDAHPHASSLRLVGNTTTEPLLDAYLPRLTELVEKARLLIVLDNLETLLTSQGTWRDPRLGRLVSALTAHSGASRVILTSRTTPAGLDRTRVTALPIHTLSRDESVLLARELPHLRALQHDTEPATRITTPQASADRELLARTLAVVQGHPKLLEIADASAVDLAVLEARVTAAEAAAAQRRTPLAAFLTTGTSQADPDQLLDALTSWTSTTASGLPEPSRLLLQFLAAAEPDDRNSDVLDDNWADLWHRLDRPGDPPPLLEVLALPVAAALVEPKPADDSDDSVRYSLHPGVADTIRADTPPETLTAIDAELAAYWVAVYEWARQQEPYQATAQLVEVAALSAVPYLFRLQDWDKAAALLQVRVNRDKTPETIAAVLPQLQHLVDASSGTEYEVERRSLLARAVSVVDPDQGELQLHDALKMALLRARHSTARGIAGDLANLLQQRGRFAEALTILDQTMKLTPGARRQAWDELADEARRLQILAHIGDAEETLAEVQRLRNRMRSLPTEGGRREGFDPWEVRELILQIGREAAIASDRWQDALNLNAEILNSKRRRGAGPHELARTAFNNYGPLLRLGRLQEADELLCGCQQQFERAKDTVALGLLLSARADLANRRGHPDAAAGHERGALRFNYVSGDPQSIAASHNNLAAFQIEVGTTSRVWLAHLLAATLLHSLAGIGRELSDGLRALARVLLDPGIAASLPTKVDQVRAIVEEVEGVHFGALCNALQPDTALQQAALDQILHSARASSVRGVRIEQHLATWEPVLAAVLAAVRGDQTDRQQADEALGHIAGAAGWAPLVGAMRRVLAGERNPDNLLAELHPADRAVITRLLDALAGRMELTAEPVPGPSTEEAIGQWEPVLADIVAATEGDQAARQQVEEFLDDFPDTSDWAALAGVLHRILDGEREPAALLAGLDPVDTAIAGRLLDALAGRIELTAEPASVPGPSTEEAIGQWGQVLTDIVAATEGDQAARQQVGAFLDDFPDTSDWAALAGVLHRILDGEREPEALLPGLDPVDTAIAGQLLDALAGRAQLPPPVADPAPKADADDP